MARKPTQDRGTASRDAILTAAMDLVAERGMAGLSHRTIAERAGVSTGMTSYFFSSLAELQHAAIEKNYASRIEDYRRIALALTESDLSGEELVDFAAAILTGSTQEMLLAHLEVYLTAGRRPEIREALTPVFDAMREIARAVAQTLGVQEREQFAAAVIALIEGTQLRRVAEGIDGTDQLRYGFRTLAVGALALQHDPDIWADEMKGWHRGRPPAPGEGA